jgi:uncharacterized protein involved in exopolysaccharide biosynthesis
MPDIFYLVSKWWKQMLTVVVLSLIASAIVLYLRPVKYLATATAIPGSSYASDKARIFNDNIQILYPTVGTPEDLDMIVGTAQLDTIYLTVVDQLDLQNHYKIKEQGDARTKAAYLLKLNTRVIKSDYNELKIKVWDKDKTIVPQMANGIVQKLETMHEDMRNESNKVILKGLENSRMKIQLQLDSLPANDPRRQRLLTDQLTQYEKLISEYELLVDNKPPVLVIAEKARVPEWPDKPKWWRVMTAAFVLSFLFSLLVALVIEKGKTTKQ